MKTTRLTQKEFDDLYEYSCSVPTLTTIGKRWKCNLSFGTDKPPNWVICEIQECDPPRPDKVSIVRTKPHILNETEQLLRNRLYQ